MNPLWRYVGVAAVVAGLVTGAACSPVDNVKAYRQLAAKVDKTAVTTWPRPKVSPSK